MPKELTIIKASGDRVPFSEEKYRESLRRSGASDHVIDQVVQQIKPHLRDGMTTKALYRQTNQLLGTLKQPAVRGRYHLKQAIIRLGPSGFPFEKYIAKLFKYQGYRLDVGQEIAGKCVMHEVDAIATKGNDRLVIECKFHSSQGQYCDIQTVLYVKARYEDIKAGCDRDLLCTPKYNQCWLVTNTRLSSVAIQYGECVGMRLMGWSYPRGAGLERIIDQSGLHPITCLSSLSGKAMQTILHAGIVLCRDLMHQQHKLAEMGFKQPMIEKVLKECAAICQGDAHGE